MGEQVNAVETLLSGGLVPSDLSVYLAGLCDANVMLMFMIGLLCNACEVTYDAKQWIQKNLRTLFKAWKA